MATRDMLTSLEAGSNHYMDPILHFCTCLNTLKTRSLKMVEATMRPCDAFHRKVHTAKSLLADPVESIVQEGDTLWLGIFCEIRIAFEHALCDFR